MAIVANRKVAGFKLVSDALRFVPLESCLEPRKETKMPQKYCLFGLLPIRKFSRTVKNQNLPLSGHYPTFCNGEVFWQFVLSTSTTFKDIQNTFSLPKHLPIAFTIRVQIVKTPSCCVCTHFQREGVLTICKCRKYKGKGLWKPLLVAKFAEKDPQMAPKACLKDGKWTPRSPAPLEITSMGFGVLC